MIAGSTLTSTCTSCLVTALSASLIAARCASLGCLGERHLRGHLALVAGDQRPVGPDHVAHREQPPVRRHQLEEVGREPADADLVEHGGEGRDLLLGGEHRAAHQAREVGTVGDQRLEPLEIGLDGVDGILPERKLEQRGRIAARHAGRTSRLRLPRRLLFGQFRGLGTVAGRWAPSP